MTLKPGLVADIALARAVADGWSVDFSINDDGDIDFFITAPGEGLDMSEEIEEGIDLAETIKDNELEIDEVEIDLDDEPEADEPAPDEPAGDCCPEASPTAETPAQAPKLAGYRTLILGCVAALTPITIFFGLLYFRPDLVNQSLIDQLTIAGTGAPMSAAVMRHLDKRLRAGG